VLAAPVASVAIGTRASPLRHDQLDLFRSAGPVPAVLGETLAALQSLCGDARVGAPVAIDTYHPDSFALAPFGSPCHASEPDPGAAGMLALRALRPPLPAQVRRHRQRPVWIRSAIANGRVVRCAGPWRTTGGWWSSEERFAFDQFDVQSEDGVVVRLRFDHVRREWQIDGVYD
jgi:protein ImuB